MQNKNLIFIGGGVVILLLLFFTFTGDGCGGKRTFSWRETYDEKSREPYGAFVFFELLKESYSEEKFTVITDSLHASLPAEPTEKSQYVFVGPAMYTDSASTQALLSFVEKGNDAFISSKTIPYDLMFYLYYEECNGILWNDYEVLQDTSLTAAVDRNEQSFEFVYYKNFGAKLYNWNYIDPSVMCEGENAIKQLGVMNDYYPNFAKVKYGNGQFYLHTTPLAFSNFSLQHEENLQYTGQVLSYLNAEAVFYDTHSRVSEGIGRRRNERNNLFPDDRRFESGGELSYILAQPPLRWAWYLALGLSLLYLVFRAKRRQRIIPVTEANRNTSLDFVGTIGQLYFQQENHQKAAEQNFKLWLGFVREKYRISSKDTDAEFAKRLAAKADVPLALVNKILEQYDVIQKATGIHSHTLIDFHALLEKFYAEAK